MSGSSSCAQATPPAFGSPSFGQSTFGSQQGGSRVVSYSATPEAESSGTQPAGKLESVSAMPAYKGKSHEVLRWEDYQRGDKDTSAFGQKLAFGGFGSTPSQPSPFGSTFQQTQLAFGCNLFGSTTRPFGASSQPAFGATSTPAFGATSTPAFGATSTPAFGATTTPAFGSTSTPTFGSTNTPAFGFTSSPLFGSTGASFGASSSPTAFGAPSSLLFGSSSTPAFGASSSPAFGSSTTAFGASSTPSFSFGSTPSFGQAAPTFGSTPFGTILSAFGSQSSPFGAQATPPAFGSPGFGQSAFGSQQGGSRVVSYSATPEAESSDTQPAGKLESVSAMPAYKEKSHEELRWEDYQHGDKDTSAFGQKLAFGGFGSTPSQPSPFGSTFQQTQLAFGCNLFGSTTTPFGASSQPAFGATSTPAFGATSTPAFGATSTPAFGATTTPAFGSTSTPTFGSTNTPAFGSTSAPLFGSTGAAFGASSSPTAFGAPSSLLFGSSSTPAFGASSSPAFGSSTTAFGASSTPSFSFGSTPSFGQAAPTFGSTPFGMTLSAFGSQSSPFGAQATPPAFGSPGFGQSAFGSQQGGSRVVSYSATPEAESSDTQPAGKLESVSAMPAYKEKSHEELRWEDYQRGDKGGPNPSGQLADGIRFPTPSQSNPFGSSTTSPFGASSSPFRQSTGFQQTTPAFGSNMFITPSTGFGGSLFSISAPSMIPSSAPMRFGETTGSDLHSCSRSIFSILKPQQVIVAAMGGGLPSVCTKCHKEMLCQFCGLKDHETGSCCWIYTRCKERACNGIRFMLTVEGKKFLKCQFEHCPGFEWLENALNDHINSNGSSSTTHSCFKCDSTEHTTNQCPWMGMPCRTLRCTGHINVYTSKQVESSGRKFIQCFECKQGFQWLEEAIAAKKEDKSHSRINIEMDFDEFCHVFGKADIKGKGPM